MRRCDGLGALTVVTDNGDVPVDNNQCTSDVCTNGVPSNPPIAINTACNQNGGSFCSGTGACVQCNAATQCPGSDTECRSRTCSAGVCGVNNTPAMQPVATQTSGDCKTNECDGFGSPVVVNTNSDLPVDNNQCTSDVCTNGVPSNPPVAINTACSQNGGSFCSGTGACVQCNAATQCPGSDTECRARTCSAGVCGATFTASGTAVSAQTPGDCQQAQCNGAGGIVNVALNTDLPVDNNQCTSDVCTNGVPSNPPLAIDTACNQNGGSFCSGSGACVQCNAATQCPGSDTECRTRTCATGVCGATFTASGTAVSAQTPGDCQQAQCNGAGGIVNVALNTDLPVDNNQCTGDVCTNGVPSNPPLAIDTACNQNGGSFCSGTGACVQCNAATQCPGSDTECRTRTCSAGVCGVNNTPAMQPVATQTAGDCKTNECDGFGSPIVVNTNGDLPVDNNQCTSDVCTNGVPSNPPLAIDTACTQNGGSFCNGGGACVQCNAATQCPGSDTECRTRTCSTGACGVSFAASGTAVSAQTPGDCQQAQCNGAGGIVSVAFNTDLPLDGNQCTNDVCSSGVPSNPPVAINAACNQNGGSFCSGTGACVQCNVATQCPGSDTECQTRTCSAGGVCGVNNTPAMQPVATQTAGDCKTNECDGFGSPIVVNANGDLPVDNNQCTSDVCTNGVPSNPPLAIDTACTQNGGSFCNGGGACVQCNAATQCPGSDTECRTRTCATGVCGATFTASGTAVSAQTPGDCQEAQCNGAGGIVSVALDTDLPVDGIQCTNDVCASGVPSNPPAAVNTACNQNGGSFCSGSGACVQCNVATQCPGSDTDCQTRTCATNSCGMSFTASGTPVSAQVTGDCKQVQCNGSGGTSSVNQDTDLPVDGLQCTDDVCTSGVPSNPPLSAGTTCSQSGGTACDGAGVCVAPPTVVSTTPADGATVAASTTIAVTFSTAMNPTTLTGQTTAGACSGSIQVSPDNFVTCMAFSAASATMSGGNTVATLTPAPGLLVNTTYKVRVTTAALGVSGAALGSAFVHATGFTTSSPNLCEGTVVISQLFGAGGSGAGVPNADFVELHNRGTTVINLAGWSIQYASAAGTTWTSVALSGSIAADGYFLIRPQAVQPTGTALPTPDATGTAINLAQAAGKLALVNSTTVLTGDCPTSATIVDFVGYGTTATCREGGSTTGSNAPAPSSTTSIQRVGSTCADVNLNASDFVAGAPAPRNSASTTQACACVARNESGAALEADYCVVQFPTSLSATTGMATSTVYGRLYEAGVTEAAGPNAAVRMQLGYGNATANPQYQAWTWSNATYNVQVGNDDEYQASFTAPAVGTYRYGYRFSLDQGVSWTVCDTDGAGSNGGLALEFANLPVLTVTP